jgi:hypothetical protein
MMTADLGNYRLALWRDQLVIVHHDAPPVVVTYADGKLEAKTLEPTDEPCTVSVPRMFIVGGA